MPKVIQDNSRIVKTDRNPARNISFTLARLISVITGIILGILFIRFLFVLLNANPRNGFANFIYDITHPFVSPFFGLFNYSPTYENSRVEIETIVAMIFYALIGWILIRLITLNDRTYEEDVEEY